MHRFPELLGEYFQHFFMGGALSKVGRFAGIIDMVVELASLLALFPASRTLLINRMIEAGKFVPRVFTSPI